MTKKLVLKFLLYCIIVSCRIRYAQMQLGYLITYCCNNVIGIESDMLHAGAAVIFDEFLDLGTFLPWRGLVDWHLHRLLPICHHDGS